ncbi:Ger(x)C family spore germination protein [Gottfriedia sp. NPDC057991]|uniref:Ger(x)C family spore germination protein n=1 Tax=Gottfriedia sp. NPDC057991 TaxID=3346298 RepID=UPI0036DEA9A0
MNRNLKIRLLMSIVLLLTGCSNYMELNKISFITGLGVDWTDKSNFKVTLQVINPTDLATGQNGGGNSSPVILYTSTGKTLSEAIREAGKKITKNKDFTHVGLTVIGENAAKHGIEEIVDAIIREPRVSAFMSVLVAKNSTAEQVLNTMTPINKVSSAEMVSKLQNVNFSLGESVNPNVFELGEDLNYSGKEIAISGVEIVNENKEKNTLFNLQTMEPAQTKIDNLALFRDSKLAGWISGRDVRGILMVLDKIQQTNFAVPCGNNKYSSLRLHAQSIKTNVKVKGNSPIISIDNTLLTLLDETGCSVNIEKVEDLIKIEKQAAKVVKQQIEHSIKSAQNYKSDVFGFGDMIHTNDPEKWKQLKGHWAEDFAKAKVNVKTTVVIKRSGLLGDPVIMKKK